MAKATYFRPQTFASPTMRVEALGGFQGVNYTDYTLDTPSVFGLDGVNYVAHDSKSALEKRYGFDKVAYLGYGKAVHGIWEFHTKEHGDFVVAHAGDSLYWCEKDPSDLRPKFALVSGSEGALLDSYCEAFSGNDSLWVLGGKKYLRVYRNGASLHCEAVYGSGYAFVPLTTINITYDGSNFSRRQGFDNPNLMTPKRKNGLLSGTGFAEGEETKGYVYQLDSRAKLTSLRLHIESAGVAEEE